ncbi:hypothetical protein [Niveibacterium sp.]|uniref:hypothetical protein n=1 Tax=Niveibacterium sp. TaxID=2017444 RepID=UPI0035B4D367
MTIAPRLASFLAALAACVVTGCATFFATTMDTRDPYFHMKPIAEDKILALGKVLKTADAADGTSGSIAFLGQQHTYLLVSGEDELLQIAQSPIGPLVEPSAESSNTQGHLFLKDAKFWGALTLTIDKNAPLSDVQRAELERLGFALHSEFDSHFTKAVSISGLVLPATQIPPESAEKLTHSRTVAFFPGLEETAPLNLKKVVAIPAAVVVDVATAPVQLLGLGALAIYFSTHPLKIM